MTELTKLQFMTNINVRYKPNPQEKEIVDSIIEENPFFEGREIFKFLLGFYKQHKAKPTIQDNFNQQRLQAIAKSFEIEACDQLDDKLISTKVKLKSLTF